MRAFARRSMLVVSLPVTLAFATIVASGSAFLAAFDEYKYFAGLLRRTWRSNGA